MNYDKYNIYRYMNKAKSKLGVLLREIGEIVTVTEVASSLGISRIEAAKILARWATQGWLVRLRRGLYAIASIEATDTDQALENEWAIIPQLFSPCYVGGWSAAEYWDFTEQIFQDICILTERHVQDKYQIVQNSSFILTHIPHTMSFGIKSIWIKNHKIQISDPHKTMIDMLHLPKIAGGVSHFSSCFQSYIKSAHFNHMKLWEYALIVNNGAVFKRLGFFSSVLLGQDHELTLLCKDHLTKGIAYIDPSIKTGRLTTNWRLLIPYDFRIEK